MSEHPRTDERLSSVARLLSDAEAQPNFAKSLVDRLTSA
jgi:hypothetical protein